MLKNPFLMEALKPDQPFCNRIQEQEELYRDMYNGMNVVLFAPRRFGKTSLVQRVQERFRREQGACIIYCQFFAVFSVDDLVDRFARAVFNGLHEHMSLFDKGKSLLAHFPSFRLSFGLNPDGTPSLDVFPAERKQEPIVRLENLLKQIGSLLEKEDFQLSIVLDEFQDIVELKENDKKSRRIEAILREYIQRHRASYVFLGSRRTVLREMFAVKERPFFQNNAKMVELVALPEMELSDFIQEQFVTAGKRCQEEAANWMVKVTRQSPYYAQALGYRAFEMADEECSLEDAHRAFSSLLENERYGYQAVVQALSVGQLKLLRALALEPTSSLTSTEFLKRYDLSLGGVQSARQKLLDMDIIEEKNKYWQVVDPVFATWMQKSFQ